MKIAILSRYQDINSRGVEIFVSELAPRLSKVHKVEIFSGLAADTLKPILTSDFDVVMPMNGRLQALKVSLGRLLKGYRVVIGGHAGIGKDDLWNLLIIRPSVYIALTKKQEIWAKKWGLGVKIVRIPNGIDLDKFKPTGEKMKINLPQPIILSVGALVWYKYHDKVIKAVSKLEKGSLLLVGEGPEKPRLEKLGREKLGNRFMAKQFSYQDMPKVYRSASLFTLPSWDREAFGIVYLEALASNIPVVAPDDLSRKEIVGSGGILVDVDYIDKYAKAIELALDMDWGDKPRKQAEKFSWDKVAKRYLNLLRSV